MRQSFADPKTADWPSLPLEEKTQLLFLGQKKMFNIFLKHDGISQIQHDKSLHDLF